MMPGFLPQEIIRAKRDGNELAAEEIAHWMVTDIAGELSS